MLRRALLWLFCLSLLAASAGAGSNREAAKLHNDLAKLAYGDAKYEEALSEFRKAYELAPFPELLFNIALCEEKLHRPEAAIRTFEQFLAVTSNATEQTEAAAHVVALRKALLPPPPVPPSPAVVLAAPLPEKPPARSPLYRRWWLWTAVGAGLAAVGAGIGIGVAVSNQPTTYPAVKLP